MSKRLITYVVAVGAIIAFILGGIPYLSESPNYASQEHVVTGVLPQAEKVVIGKYEVVSLDSLDASEQQFTRGFSGESGVFRKDDLVLFTLGGENKSMSFERQENHSNEVRIFVRFSDKPKESSQQAGILIGKIQMSGSVLISFYDAETGNFIY